MKLYSKPDGHTYFQIGLRKPIREPILYRRKDQYEWGRADEDESEKRLVCAVLWVVLVLMLVGIWIAP